MYVYVYIYMYTQVIHSIPGMCVVCMYKHVHTYIPALLVGLPTEAWGSGQLKPPAPRRFVSTVV